MRFLSILSRYVLLLFPLCLGAAFTSTPFAGTLGDVSWQGVWRTEKQEMKLDVSVQNNSKDKVEFLFDFPVQNWVNKKSFTYREGTHTFSVAFPTINPQNRYQIDAFVTVGEQMLKTTLSLTGDQVNPLLIRTPEMAAPNYRFGACSHFDWGQNDINGWGGGWHDYKAVIDSMRECNIFITRGNVGPGIKDPKTGKYHLGEYNEKWINYAIEHGVEVVAIVDLFSNRTVEETAQAFADIGERYPQLKYIEIGNEPYNFGDWRKDYKGEWNSSTEKNGDPAPWVAAVLKYSNAAAEALRKVRPDIVIIGMDTLPCNTLRAFNKLKISPAINGIAMHPYGYSLPPEYLPWGEGFIARDGISTGDAECTVYGWAQKFADAFAKSGANRKLWLTEWGYPTFNMHPAKTPNGMYVPHTEEAQAVYILRRQLEYLRLGNLLGGSLLYDYMDDGFLIPQNWESHEAEASFGIMRPDRTKKKAWYVMQRFNTLLAHADSTDRVQVVEARCNLDPIMQREKNIMWDRVNLPGKYGVRTLPLMIPDGKEKQLAIVVWSERRYDREFGAGGLYLRFNGAFHKNDTPFTVIDLITGKSFDANWKKNGDIYELADVGLGSNPLLLLLGPAEGDAK